METDGFIPIKAVFYAVFHPIEGTKVVHQVPENTILTPKREKTESKTNKNGYGGYNRGDKNEDNQKEENKVDENEGYEETKGDVNKGDDMGHEDNNEYYEQDENEDDYDNDFESDSDSESSSYLFNFDTVKNYVIPKPQLCNKLISFKINNYKVIGFPVRIENERYSRNSFNFNFCFVFPYDFGDVKPYEPAITWIGKMFQALEEQSFMLSRLDDIGVFFKEEHQLKVKEEEEEEKAMAPGHRKTKRITLSSIESLLHQIYQDLNNFSECCIPLNSASSVDIKLFPILPPPVNIKAHQVPNATVKLNQLVDVNWDPTMTKILPYINGINSIKRISELADSNYLLTKQCIQHLMHYKCIEIADIFQFSNIYAPTNTIGSFLKLGGRMAEECQAYVITQQSLVNASSQVATPNQVATPAATPAMTPAITPAITPVSVLLASYSMSPMTKSFLRVPAAKITVPSKLVLFYLYRSLNQGQTIKEWYVQHRKLLTNIDIRRFIHFGVMRGIIYRVQSYPVLDSIVRALQNEDHAEYYRLIDEMKQQRRQQRSSQRKNSRLRLDPPPPQPPRRVDFGGVDGIDSDEDAILDSLLELEPEDELELDEELDGDVTEEQEMVKLFKILKGYQHFDSICTELQKPRKEVERMIAELGSYSVINS